MSPGSRSAAVADDLWQIQFERIVALSEFRRDVGDGSYPEAKHNIGIDAEVLDRFQHFFAQPS